MVSPTKARATAAPKPPTEAPTGAQRAHKQVAGHPSPAKPRTGQRLPAAAPQTAAVAPAPPADPLDQLAAGDPLRVIALMLWIERYRNPEFAVQIKPEDLKGFSDCTGYLGVSPKVIIRRPPGQPAHPGVPPSKRYPEGIPPRAAEPPRPYVLVSMVDDKGDAFKPIENSEEGARRRDRENNLRAMRDRAPILAQTVASGSANNTFNSSEIIDLCNIAIELARA